MSVAGCFFSQMLTIRIIFSCAHNHKFELPLLWKLFQLPAIFFSFEFVPLKVKSLNKKCITFFWVLDKVIYFLEWIWFRKIQTFQLFFSQRTTKLYIIYFCIAINVRKSTTVASLPPLKLVYRASKLHTIRSTASEWHTSWATHTNA